jgi:hypothetical protein
MCRSGTRCSQSYNTEGTKMKIKKARMQRRGFARLEMVGQLLSAGLLPFMIVATSGLILAMFMECAG